MFVLILLFENLVATLASESEFLVAKEKMLVALATISVAISSPGYDKKFVIVQYPCNNNRATHSCSLCFWQQNDKIWQKETAVIVLTRIPLEIIQSVHIGFFFSLFWFYSVGVYHKFIKLAREECPWCDWTSLCQTGNIDVRPPVGKYINKELVYWFWKNVRPEDRAGNYFLCQMLSVNFSLSSKSLMLKKFV